MILSIGPLRAISLTRQEPEAGTFRWLLLESHQQAEWVELLSADVPDKTYVSAVAKGLVALQALVHDLDIGPREEAPTKSKSAVSGRFFGFGGV